MRASSRYRQFGEIATGGMATVHYGTLMGPAGFARTVAIKCLHPHLAHDPEFVAMFLDEARLAARIHHPNVVSTLDVVAEESKLLLVLEYVHGESLAKLQRAARRDDSPMPLGVASAILCDALHGLHAAHEATDERGDPLHLVHRDVSPQNVLVGADGISKVLDFGVAKAVGRSQDTSQGKLKGKLAYMSPEQIRGGELDRRSDVYAAGIVLWEVLTGDLLFAGENDGQTAMNVLERQVAAPSTRNPGVPEALDAVVLRALSRDPGKRFDTARAMATALESAVPAASPRLVAAWVESLAGDVLAERRRAVHIVELASKTGVTPPSVPSAQSGRTAPSEGSNVSSISVAAAKPAAAASRWRLAALPLAFLAGGLGWAMFSGTTPAKPASVPAVTESAASVPTAASLPGDSAAPAATAPAGASASAATASALPSGAPSTARGATAKTAASSPHKPASAGKTACGVRTYVDKSGYTRFARECP